jgi:hypothetical protein
MTEKKVDYRSKDYVGFAGEWRKGIERARKKGYYKESKDKAQSSK